MIGELHVVLLPGTNMAWLHARSSGTISSSRCQITRTSKQPIGPFDMCEFIFCGRAIQARSAITSLAFQPRPSRSIKSGGARRDRTDDLLLAKQALSQLSYGPATHGTQQRREMVGLGRFELPTSRLSSARSNQLSYRPNF